MAVQAELVLIGMASEVAPEYNPRSAVTLLDVGRLYGRDLRENKEA